MFTVNGTKKELPGVFSVKEYLEQNGIDIIYGMEWLTKNGRSVEENRKLTEQNPFLPYAVIMEQGAYEKFEKLDKENYTKFPVPIIKKDELEKLSGSTVNHITSMEHIRFYIFFNHHLLDRSELEKMLEEIKSRIETLQKSIDEKEKELDTYRNYKNCIEYQSYSEELYQQTERELQYTMGQKTGSEEKRLKIRNERADIEEVCRKTEMQINQLRKNITEYENKQREFEKLCRKYEVYGKAVMSLKRIRNEKEELLKVQKQLTDSMKETEFAVNTITDKLKRIQEQEKYLRKKRAEYETYAKEINIEAKAMIDIATKQIIPAVIRYTTTLAQSINAVKAACGADISVQTEILMEVSDLLADTKNALSKLEEVTAQGAAMAQGREQAVFYRDEVMTAMKALRTPVDKLEMLVDKSMWPMPSYGDLMFEV